MWELHLVNGDLIPNSSCKSCDALRLTLHLSPHTQDGTNDDLISRFIVPELIDFKEAILKYGSVFGIISTVLVVVSCCMGNAISCRFISFKWLWWSNIFFFCCWTMDNFTTSAWAAAFYIYQQYKRYINTQKLPLSGIILKVFKSK